MTLCHFADNVSNIKLTVDDISWDCCWYVNSIVRILSSSRQCYFDDQNGMCRSASMANLLLNHCGNQ